MITLKLHEPGLGGFGLAVETAEVVVGSFLRSIMAVDDATDVIALKYLCLIEALLLETLDEGICIAHGDIAREDNAYCFLRSFEGREWSRITCCT